MIKKRSLAMVALAVFLALMGSRSEGAILPGSPVAPSGSLTYWAPGNFGAVRSTMETNGPETIVALGDSLVTGQLMYPLASAWASSYGNGWANFQGQPGISYGNWSYVITNTAGVTTTSSDFTTWFSPYLNVPNGEGLVFFITNSTITGAFGQTGNVIGLDYVEENGALTFKIQTNAPGGAWADFQTGINANNGGAKHGVALRFTNAFRCTTMVKVVGTSAGTAVKVTGACVLDQPGRGVTLEMFAQGSLGMDQWNQVPTNIWGPIVLKRNWTLVISKWLDSSAIMQTGLPVYHTNRLSYFPSANQLWIACNPTRNPATSDPTNVLVQNAVMRAYAIAYQEDYFDGYQTFGRGYPDPLAVWTNGVANGLLSNAQDPHPTVLGDLNTAEALLQQAQWFRADGKLYGRQVYDYGSGFTAQQATQSVFATVAGNANGVQFGFNTLWADNSLSIRAPHVDFGLDTTATGFDSESLNLRNKTMGIFPNGYIKFFDAASHCYHTVFPYTNLWPAAWVLYTQTVDGSCTNLSILGIATATNTWWGSGVNSIRLEASTLEAGTTVEGYQEGLYFTPAAPLSCRIMLMMNSATATNICGQVLVTPPANIAWPGDMYRLRFEHTCRSTGVSGTVSTTGSIQFFNAGAISEYRFTNGVTTVDTTVQLRADVMSTNGATADSFMSKNGGLVLR